ncbi:MAG: sulfotransferase [Myxococcota bacterium]
MGEAEIKTMQSMAARYQRPDWVRRMNAMGDSVGGGAAGARRMIPFEAEAWIDECAESLGLSASNPELGEFGDPLWRRRYASLVATLDAADMNVVGRLMTKQELLRSLRTRMQLHEMWAAHPEIAEEEIIAPILVTGPARSGTSIMFELLWLDPDLRGPVGAEALHPVAAGGESLSQRLEWSECEQEFWADVQPEFAAVHELRSDLPVECITLTTGSFCGAHWGMIGAIGMETDMVETYAFEKRALQVLQFGQPKRTWLLKTPGHLLMLDLVFNTFPDAWIVQTHRDPAKTMPSTVSATSLVQWMRMDEVNLEQHARSIGMAFTAGLNSVTERRAAGDWPDRFQDVPFQSLVQDPVETLRGVYEGMGRPFTDAHGERIRAYLAEKPKGKFGVHRYTPEEWGFTATELRTGLAPYIEGFGVALED